MYRIKRVINRVIKCYEIQTIPVIGKTVFLTFDDGPELGITEFVLENLDDYGFKATFFCRGDNAEKHPELISLLREKGHSIGNHTYNHVHAFDVSAKKYLFDVKKADEVLKTSLFRPPHGSLTLTTWLKLHKRFNVVYWALNSEDSSLEKYNYQHAIKNLKSRTKPGDVVLFHFCKRHENETRELLPMYLKWLKEEGYTSSGINADFINN